MSIWAAIIFIAIGVILFVFVIARTIYRCVTYHGCCKTKEDGASLMPVTLTSNKSEFFEMEVVEPEKRDSMQQPDLDPLDAEKLALQREKEKLNELLFDPSRQHPVDEYDPDGYYPQVSLDGEDSGNVGYDEPDVKVAKPKTELSPTANNGTDPPPGSNGTKQHISSHQESNTYMELDLKDVSPHTEDFTALVSKENPDAQPGTDNPNYIVDSSDSEQFHEITIVTV